MTIGQRLSASRMIQAKGQAVTIVATTGGAYDPATGAVSGATSTTITTSLAVLPLSPSRKVDGSNIVASDKTLLISAVDSDGDGITLPPVGSIVTLANGAKLAIVAIDEINPAGLPIMFDAVGRAYQ